MHKETLLGCQPNVYLSFTCTVPEEVTSKLLKLLFLKRNKVFTFFIICYKWLYNVYLVKQAAFFKRRFNICFVFKSKKGYIGTDSAEYFGPAWFQVNLPEMILREQENSWGFLFASGFLFSILLLD